MRAARPTDLATLSVHVCVCVCVCVQAQSVVSNSSQPHGLQPTRLLCPWDFPGKHTGVGCHFLLQGIFHTQGLNLCLMHHLYWQVYFLPSEPLGKPLSVNLLFTKYFFLPLSFCLPVTWKRSSESMNVAGVILEQHTYKMCDSASSPTEFLSKLIPNTS